MKRIKYIILGAVILIVGYLGFHVYTNFIREEDPIVFENEIDHFLYGSIGAEVDGFPYRIWRILPWLFKDKIPQGYSQFGFLQEEGEKLPIGLSIRKYDIKRIGLTVLHVILRKSIINFYLERLLGR